jgi:hypothetical protein
VKQAEQLRPFPRFVLPWKHSLFGLLPSESVTFEGVLKSDLDPTTWPRLMPALASAISVVTEEDFLGGPRLVRTINEASGFRYFERISSTNHFRFMKPGLPARCNSTDRRYAAAAN